jgi:S-disulfanyl-L-cysteine oxidoreductase SoxD
MNRARIPKSAGIACFVSTILLVVAASGFGGQGTERSIRDGVYTKAQADRGGTAFAARCTACHGDPNFGPSVIDSRDGTPVAELFTFMSTAMPEDNPGSLRPEEYADVLAYFISSRGLPAGAADLPADVETLKQIRIEKPLEGGSGR